MTTVRTGPPPGWVAACTLAETIGLTAAATAARVAEHADSRAVGLAVIVAGGLVEGTALGALQAHALGVLFRRLPRARWTAVTVLVAGLGWAGASAPSALSADSGEGGPPWPLAVLGGLALGAAMGALLGAAQATQLRALVPHPWRWASINAAAWAPAMAVIFTGAALPGESWPTATVALLGALTGAVAGAVLGVLTGWLMPALAGGEPVRRQAGATVVRSAHVPRHHR